MCALPLPLILPAALTPPGRKSEPPRHESKVEIAANKRRPMEVGRPYGSINWSGRIRSALEQGTLGLVGQEGNCRMRRIDIDRLSKPYTEDTNVPIPEPSSALGVATPKWKRLELTILEDLSTEVPYGVAWWAPHPGTSRRILISDQLYACTCSVLDNMVESALHLLEALDWSDRESDRLANVVRIEKGSLVVRMPRPQNPLDALGNQMVRLHVAGTVRALAEHLTAWQAPLSASWPSRSRFLKRTLGPSARSSKRSLPALRRRASEFRQTSE